ncbi:MAG TPA: Do family serine endopeptidase [Steroidobacteraceae bacterium]|jgi:serine protease Do|nr:Do family serine endopeptidase [Steroidobacteraceae bacterium]
MQIPNRTLALSVVGLLAIGTAAGAAAPSLLHAHAAMVADTAATDSAAATPAPAAPFQSVPLGTAPNYRAIVKRNEAAVVGITTEGPMPTSDTGQVSPFGDDDDNPLAQFFRSLPQQPRHRGTMHAQGSGFIVSADGIVLTNAHVVNGAKEVMVKLANHREYRAKVLGADKTSDIAVLKIDAHDLPTVHVGNSDRLSVGDYVLAIGEPFGLEETATAGIVSATGRSLPGDGYVPFIQTDAAVNPGNSGGPLFDSDGSVVGINAQIYTNSGGYQGVSFAIPINLAMQVKDQIVKTGKATHARLGVEVQTLTQSLADSFKIQAPNGALVAKVEPGSPAAKAGIKAGDVILKMNGNAVLDAGQLSAAVGTTAPGNKVQLEIWRNGRSMTIDATVDTTGGGVETADNGNAAAPQARLGLAVRPLSPDEKRQSGISSGLVVEDAQGHAADAGIQPGDVVLSVDGTAVESVGQLRKLVQEHDKQVALLIQRGENRLFVPVTLG